MIDKKKSRNRIQSFLRDNTSIYNKDLFHQKGLVFPRYYSLIRKSQGQENMRNYSYNCKTPTFYPSDYNTTPSKDAKTMAFQDARNHANFYKELVEKGVYPKGTKVKAKKLRWSNGYGIELFMPHLKNTGSKRLGLFLFLLNKHQRQWLSEKEIDPTRSKIIDIAEKWGWKGVLHEDIYRGNNYMYQDNQVRYIDSEIFKGNPHHKLPFYGRKNDEELIRLNFNRNLSGYTACT